MRFQLKRPRFSLRLRLSLSIFAIVALFTLTNITYQISGDNRNQRLDNLQKAVQGQLTSVSIRRLIENQQNEILVLDALKKSDEETLKDSEINNGIEKLNDIKQQILLLAKFVYPEAVNAYQQLRQSHFELEQLWIQFYEGYNSQQTPDIASIEIRYIETTERLKQFEDLEIQAAESQTKELQSSSKVTDRFTLIIYLVTVVLTVGLGYLLIRYTIRSLSDLIDGTIRIGGGDLNHHIPVNFDDEIGDLAIAFNEMSDKLRNAIAQVQQSKEKADQANQAKTNFLANMSHELRTPLNAIIGYSEMIIEVYREENFLDEEQAVSDLQHILGSGRHLLQLINDILDLAKIESGNMSVFNERFDSVKIIEEILTTMQPIARKGNNKLIVKSANEIPQLYSDAIKFRQIIINLLSNACKFTENGKISVLVSHDEVNNKLIYHITDSGIGMSPDQLQHIFEAFVQAETDTAKEYGGTGLGLAICRQFVELMGGSLDVTSAVGEGTTFTIILPVRPKAAKKHDVIPTENQQELGLKIADSTNAGEATPTVLLGNRHQLITNLDSQILQHKYAIAPDLVDITGAQFAIAVMILSPFAQIQSDPAENDANASTSNESLVRFEVDWAQCSELIRSAAGKRLPVLVFIETTQSASIDTLNAFEFDDTENRRRLTTQLRLHNPAERRGTALLTGYANDDDDFLSGFLRELAAEAWQCKAIDTDALAMSTDHDFDVDVVMVNDQLCVNALHAMIQSLLDRRNKGLSVPALYIVPAQHIANARVLDRPANQISFL